MLIVTQQFNYSIYAALCDALDTVTRVWTQITAVEIDFVVLEATDAVQSKKLNEIMDQSWVIESPGTDVY